MICLWQCMSGPVAGAATKRAKLRASVFWRIFSFCATCSRSERMSFLPTKYVPIEYSIIGIASLLLSQMHANDTVSTLWDRVSGEPQVRTFDRYADALTLLF